jgi:hypothetical protein
MRHREALEGAAEGLLLSLSLLHGSGRSHEHPVQKPKYTLFVNLGWWGPSPLSFPAA